MCLVAAAGIVSSDVSGDAACHFVGSRFANSESVCNDGVCSKIGRRSAGIDSDVFGDVEAITCDTAVAEMRSVFNAQRVAWTDSPPADAHILLAWLADIVVPALESWALGLGVTKFHFYNHAAHFDALTLQMASADWEHWSEIIVPRVTSSSEWHAVQRAYRMMLRVAREASYLDHHPWLTQVLLFYFDLVALFGAHSLASAEITGLRDATLHADPVYRRRHASERSSVRELLVTSPTGIIQLSKSIERFGSHASNDEDLIRLELGLRGWEAERFSSSRAIIEDQITWSLCPDLARVFEALRSRGGRTDQRKVGVTLIDFCHQRVPQLYLLEAQSTLALILNDDDFDAPFRGEHAGTPASVLLDDFLRDMFPTGLGWEEFPLNALGGSAREFGRLVGFCIIEGADISFLRVSAGVADMLHPRLRKRMTTIEALKAHLGGTSVEVFNNFLYGVEEVMNPGGFFLFSPDEWLALFCEQPDLYSAL